MASADDTQKLVYLRQQVQNVLDGNYPSPRSSRPNKCTHDRWYYEGCEQCVDEYLAAAMEITKDD